MILFFQMVGLTASVGVGKSRTVEEAVEYILRLCARLDVTTLSTVKRCRENLLKWINIPKEGLYLSCNLILHNIEFHVHFHYIF